MTVMTEMTGMTWMSGMTEMTRMTGWLERPDDRMTEMIGRPEWPDYWMTGMTKWPEWPDDRNDRVTGISGWSDWPDDQITGMTGIAGMTGMKWYDRNEMVWPEWPELLYIYIYMCVFNFSIPLLICVWKEIFHEGKAVYGKHVGIFFMFSFCYIQS
jgi:hypothetical protein